MNDESRNRINAGAGRLNELSRKILGIDWYATESQARRVIEHFAEAESQVDAGIEAAPVQDEQHSVITHIELCITNLKAEHQTNPRVIAEVLCNIGYRRAARPAQPAQQPVATILFPDPLDEREGVSLSHMDIRRLAALPAGTKLYTSPQPQQSGLPEELFDGHAVYQETVSHRRDSVLLVRTSPENVSDTLDAVVRLIKSRTVANLPDLSRLQPGVPVPISSVPGMREYIAKGLADGTLTIGGAISATGERVECVHEFVMFSSKCVKCGEPYGAPALTGGTPE